MWIEVLSVSVEHMPGKNGGYKKAEIAFKDSEGKVQGKKIMSFSNPVVFNTLSEAKQGDKFDVTSQKDDKGFWQWTAISVADISGSGSSPSSGSFNTTNTMTKASPAPKSNYETPEERATRQVYIIRQSSISNAIAMLAAANDKKTAINPDTVIHVAKHFEAYVFGTKFDDGSIMALESDLTFDNQEIL